MLTIGQMANARSVDFSLLADVFPDGVAARRDLVRMGIDPSTASRRCLPGGGWTRLFPGVYLLTGGAPSRRQLVRGALLRAGPLTAVTGIEAVRRYGVKRIPDDNRIHVLVPHGRGLKTQGLLLVERTNRPWSGRLLDGFPVVSLARSLIDAARRETRLDVVRAMTADAVQRQLCAPRALADELRDIRLGGTALPRRALAEIGDGVRSAAEAWSRSLIQRSPLPAPQRNVLIRSATGKQLAIVDAWWDDVGLAWQIDSVEYHLSPEDYRRTMDQHSALLACGVMTVHTVPSRLLSDPKGVIAELVGAHAAAGRGRRPDVTATLWRPV